MTDETGPEIEEQEVDVDSTGDEALDKRLSQPVLKGTSGIDVAQVWISAFLIVIVGLIVYSTCLDVPVDAGHPDFVGEAFPPDFSDWVIERATEGNARPLTVMTLLINDWFAYPDFPPSPFGYRVVNLALHLLNGVLVYLVARKLLRGKVNEPTAMLAGMIFVLHPLCSEAVNFLPARSHLLMTALALASILLYIRGSIIVSVAFFVLACLSHEAALILPIMLIAVDFVVRDKGTIIDRWLQRHAPFLAAVVALLVVSYASGYPVLRPELFEQLSLTHRLAVLVVVPFSLNVAHAEPERGILVQALSLSFMLVASLIMLVKGRSFKKEANVLGLILFWFVFSQFVLAVTAPFSAYAQDHKSYLVLACFALVIPAALAIPNPKYHRALIALIVILFMLYSGVSTFQRNLLWADDVELWQEALQDSKPLYEELPDTILPHRALGGYYVSEAESLMRVAAMGDLSAVEKQEVAAETESMLEEANGLLAMAIKIAPEDQLAHRLLGKTLRYQGKRDEALRVLLEALELDSNDEESTLQIATLLEEKGLMEGDLDELARALDYYERADGIAPLPPQLLLRYAMALASVGDHIGAEGVAGRIPVPEGESAVGEQIKSFGMRAEQLRSMIATYRELAQDESKSSEVQLLRGRILLTQQHNQRAAYVLENLLGSGEGDSDVWVLLGYAMAKLGTHGRFLDWWREPPAGDSEESPWMRLAGTCAAGAEWDAALAYLSASDMEGAPEFALAEIAVSVGQPQVAMKTLYDAANKNQNDPEPWLRLCDLAWASKDTASATKFLYEAEKRGADEAALKRRREAMGIKSSTGSSGRPRTMLR